MQCSGYLPGHSPGKSMHLRGLVEGGRREILVLEMVEDIQLILNISQGSPILPVSSQKVNGTIFCCDPICVVKTTGIVFAFGMCT